MKKLYILILAAFTATSCSDLLDTQPLNSYSEEVVWSDPTLAQSFIYFAAEEIFREYLAIPAECENLAQGVGASTDIHTDNFGSKYSGEINLNTLTATTDVGWDRFSLIRKANVIIEQAAASSSLAESTKTNYVAQGKFLRAMIYYKMAKMFGSYIVIDKVLDTDDELNLPRTETIKETYDFIVNDLIEAAEALPSGVSKSQISKGAALALLSEVALQAAAYSESGQDEFYEISKDACEELFAIGEFSLDPDYKDMFGDYDGAWNNSELIYCYFNDISYQPKCFNTPMYKTYPNLLSTNQHENAYPKLVQNMNCSGPVFGHQPTFDLMCEYEVIDEDGVAKKWNETSYYKNYRQGVDYASTVLFHNRDARFDETLVRDSTVFGNNLLYMRVGGNAHNASGLSGLAGSISNPSGIFLRKTMNETEYLYWGATVEYFYVIFRLGRVYLNYAEALLRTGETSKALEYINMTRTTHGDLPPLSTSLSSEDAWTAYKSERRVELVFENDRYWSLLRWGKANGDSDIPELGKDLTTTVEIGADGKSFTEGVTVHDTNYVTYGRRVWAERKYLMPVPQTYIDLSEGTLKQNPLW